ncbi:hypothetical protein EYC80_002152 [Monilinia laxa]|uniref:Uncharacterized protein n=1 Tax=Monilinia laxa TaxID=61186 RepID=A0A5N6K2Y9_MONLA|nr:hypothetical protein EYC80_002152 [Monilinia laxa]
MFTDNTEEPELSTSQSLANSPPTVGSGDPKNPPLMEVNNNSSFHNINSNIAYHGSIRDHRSVSGQDPKDSKLVPSPRQTHIVAHKNITFPQESYVRPDPENKLNCRQDIAPSNAENFEQNMYQNKDKTPLASWQTIESWHIKPQHEDAQCLRKPPMSKRLVLKNFEDEMRK